MCLNPILDKMLKIHKIKTIVLLRYYSIARSLKFFHKLEFHMSMFNTNILKVAFVDLAPPYKSILNRHWSFRYDCLFANCFTAFALYFFNSPLSSCCSTSFASVFDTFRYLILFLLVVLFLLFLLVSLLLILPSHVTHRIR